MPSKDYNGQNPLGQKRSNSLAQVELQVGRLQPTLSLQSGSLQTPNGRISTGQKFVPTTQTPISWKLSTFREDNQWKYRVGFGLLNNIVSDSFDDETRTFTGELPNEDEIQIGLKVQLNAPVNIAGYVMPGFDDSIITGGVTYGSLLTFVAEAFDDFRFAALNLPNGTTPTGFAVIPIGKIIKVGDTESYAVDLQILNKNVSGIYSPINGYVVY